MLWDFVEVIFAVLRRGRCLLLAGRTAFSPVALPAGAAATDNCAEFGGVPYTDTVGEYENTYCVPADTGAGAGAGAGGPDLAPPSPRSYTVPDSWRPVVYLWLDDTCIETVPGATHVVPAGTAVVAVHYSQPCPLVSP